MVKVFIIFLIVFILFFRTWNLITHLIRYRNCIPDRVQFLYTEDRISAGGSTYFRFGYLKNQEVYLDNEAIQNDTILNVWRTNGMGRLYAYDRKIGETEKKFKLRLIVNYFKSFSIWIGIFLTLHFITLTIKRYVHIEEMPPHLSKIFMIIKTLIMHKKIHILFPCSPKPFAGAARRTSLTSPN